MFIFSTFSKRLIPEIFMSNKVTKIGDTDATVACNSDEKSPKEARYTPIHSIISPKSASLSNIFRLRKCQNITFSTDTRV